MFYPGPSCLKIRYYYYYYYYYSIHTNGFLKRISRVESLENTSLWTAISFHGLIGKGLYRFCVEVKRSEEGRGRRILFRFR